MNVVLIVVDALRPDHLGINRYPRDTSPNIDTIAKNGISFSNAITAIPSSDPSISSILTGMYPHSHGLRLMHRQKLDSNITTLPEILKDHGYKTIGYNLDSMEGGIKDHFDDFSLLRWRIENKIMRTMKKMVSWKSQTKPAEELTKIAKKQIRKYKDKPFFMYLHYSDLHWPYNPPKPYGEIFDPDYKGNHIFNGETSKISRGEMIFNNSLPKEEIHHAIAHYDGSIKFVDTQIEDLRSHLEKLQLKDKTMFIITADHGESLGEHNLHFEHSLCLYEEGIRIPLIIDVPELPCKKITTQVQTIDIMPTILDVLDIPLIDNIDGKSLVPIINGEKDDRKYLFAENGDLTFKENNRSFYPGIEGKWRMIRSSEWKLIFIPHPKNDIYELYNLKEDPNEKTNLIHKEKVIAENLKKELFDWMKDEKEEETDPTEKSKKLLRKLGYME